MIARSRGPRFLAQEDIAALVVASLFRGATMKHYQLGPFVIMPNHVHVLLLPHIHPSRLMKSLKGYTAWKANKLLGRIGEPFWQRESYDHWIRDVEEWQRVAAYIEENPVRVGLAVHADEFPWSSANQEWRDSVGMSADVARTSACSTYVSKSGIRCNASSGLEI